MLTGVHFLLTYQCNLSCDHCFLYCNPWSKGTFTIDQVVRVLDESKRLGTVEWIFFEGGEPFLFFPLLIESVKAAKQRGFRIGVVTNAYGAISEADAEPWLTSTTIGAPSIISSGVALKRNRESSMRPSV